MFHPNDKVVCVNDDFRASVFGVPAERFDFPQGVPRKGQVYCVHAVFPAYHGTQGLELCGLPIFTAGHESGWNSSRFRKVQPENQSQRTTREQQQAKPIRVIILP